MYNTKNKNPMRSKLQPAKIKTLKPVQKKSKIWLIALGILCILAGVVLLLVLPGKDGKLKDGSVTEVSHDIRTVKNEQLSVDEGLSPWKLDPVLVTQVFVSLQISPAGIEGEHPIRTEELTLIQMTKSEAAVQVKSKQTNIFLVHLKRLVRKDATGIWTVVAYETTGENVNKENIPKENIPKENIPKENKENIPQENKENVPKEKKGNQDNINNIKSKENMEKEKS